MQTSILILAAICAGLFIIIIRTYSKLHDLREHTERIYRHLIDFNDQFPVTEHGVFDVIANAQRIRNDHGSLKRHHQNLIDNVRLLAGLPSADIIGGALDHITTQVGIVRGLQADVFKAAKSRSRTLTLLGREWKLVPKKREYIKRLQKNGKRETMKQARARLAKQAVA